MTKIQSFYSREPINTSRQLNADILKMLAILFMVFCHTVCFMNHDYESGLYIFTAAFLGRYAGGAPAFMLLMGFGIIYSKKNDPKSLFFRGLKLICLGFLLNFLKTSLTVLIIEPSLFFDFFLFADILHFAGLAFMALALFKKLKVKSYIVLIIATILSSTAFLFYGLETGNKILDCFINFFVPTSQALCGFSFASWFIFVVVGMFIGNTVQRIKNLDKFYLFLLIPTFIVAVPGYFIASSYCTMDLHYYGIYFPYAFCYICASLCLLSVYHFLSKVLPTKVLTFAKSVSTNITAIFFIHWCVIGPFVAMHMVKEMKSLPIWFLYIVGVVLFIASYCLSIVNQYIKKAIKQRKMNKSEYVKN